VDDATEDVSTDDLAASIRSHLAGHRLGELDAAVW
jgi:hypothetical protein